MQIINKPEILHEVQCYKCGTIFKVHPMQCMNSPYITECSYHERGVTSLPIDKEALEALTEPA